MVGVQRCSSPLKCLAACLAASAAYVLVPRAKYTATATLHVSTKPKRIMFDPQERETDFRTYQKTQVNLLKNRKVLSHALTNPEVAGLATIREQVDPEEWLDLNLKADFPGGSEVLQVALSGDLADDLAKIVNSVVKSYMTVIVEEERRERIARLDALRLLREKYEAELKLKRKSLRELVSNVGLSDEKALALSQQFKVEHLGLAQRELIHARSELLKAESEQAVVEAAGSQPSARFRRVQATVGAPPTAGARPSAIVDESIKMDPRIRELKTNLDQLGQKRQKLEARVRNLNDPSIVSVRREQEAASRALDEAVRLIASERASAAGNGPPGGPREGGAGGLAGLSDAARARSQVAVWKAYGEALTKDIQRLQGEVKETTDKGLDLETEREEIAIATDISRRVRSEVEAVQVELNAPERIQVLAEARIPNRKDELRKAKAAGGAALGGFACALLGVSFWEYRARRVSAAHELVSGLGIRLVGTLPAQPRHLRQSDTDRRWQNRLVESVDAMRAILLHASRSDGTRVVMIASAMKGEGKTTLACHLATSLARGGRRALLIDADLRSPACHLLFEAPLNPGLCEVLRGECDIEDAIHEGRDLGPALLTAGRMDAFALQGLSQDGLRSLVDELRTRYDFIVIDSAPVLPVADSLLVGQAVDAVIFSVMREVSRLPMIYEAHERLEALGVRMLGAVLAGVRETSHAYEYQSQLIA